MSLLPPKEPTSQEETDPVSVRVPKSWAAKLKEISERTGYPVAEIIRRSIDLWLKQYEAEQQAPGPKRPKTTR